jgi:bacterioferritin-associated ferredoxin
VSDRKVREVLAKGATTRFQVMRACRAGSRCGGCHPVIEELIARHAAATHAACAPVASPELAAAR